MILPRSQGFKTGHKMGLVLFPNFDNAKWMRLGQSGLFLFVILRKKSESTNFSPLRVLKARLSVHLQSCFPS